VNVIKTSEVQKASKERNLVVHGWVFDVKTGRLTDLKIDFKHILEEIMEIYRII
jgi:carbonic anhydrase